MNALAIENLVVAAVAGVTAFTYWPFDWRGRRRVVKLHRGRRPWE